MKFSKKFNYLKYLEVDEGILRGLNPVPCTMCQKPTVFIDLCAEAPFCSDECMLDFYTQMWEGPSEV